MDLETSRTRLQTSEKFLVGASLFLVVSGLISIGTVINSGHDRGDAGIPVLTAEVLAAAITAVLLLLPLITSKIDAAKTSRWGLLVWLGIWIAEIDILFGGFDTVATVVTAVLCVVAVTGVVVYARNPNPKAAVADQNVE